MDIDAITFNDDEPDPEPEPDTGSGDGKGTGEWVVDLVDRLDEKGMLDAILFGPERAAQLNGEGTAPEPADQDGDGGGTIEAGAIDADAVASLGKQIIDTAGDRKISEIVYMAEQRPDAVNQLIAENMGEVENEDS